MFRPMLFAVIAFPAGSAFAAEPLTRQPYIQNVKRTEVTIMWRTAKPVKQTVQYGPKGNWSSRASDSEPTTHHEVTLRGLSSGMTYNYRILQGASLVKQDDLFTFKTDPGPHKGLWSFFATGDVGEDEVDKSHQDLTQAKIRSFSPRADLGIIAGDVVYPDGESSMYDELLMSRWQELLCNTPVWPTLGNHDWHVDPEQNFVKEWALPNNEHYYAFEYANARFIALDTGEGEFYDETNQLEFLSHELSRPTEADWTFVYYHYPLYTCTYKSNKMDMANKLYPILQAGGVDMVFTGHAHTFERTYPLWDFQPMNIDEDPNYTSPQGPIFVVSGTGGKYKEMDEDDYTTFCGPTAAFSDEKPQITQVFIQERSLLMMTYNIHTGQVEDMMTLAKPQTTASAEFAPAGPRLTQNIPNPFNPATAIPFELPKPAYVTMSIYGADGRFIRSLAQGQYLAGMHKLTWNGRDQYGRSVASGVYVAKLQSGQDVKTMKMMLVR